MDIQIGKYRIRNNVYPPIRRGLFFAEPVKGEDGGGAIYERRRLEEAIEDAFNGDLSLSEATSMEELLAEVRALRKEISEAFNWRPVLTPLEKEYEKS